MGRRKVAPFVVVYGTEEFYLDREIEEARASRNRQVVVLDGDDVTDSELVDLCEVRMMDDRDRIVVVDNAGSMKDTGALSSFIEQKAQDDLSVILVAIIRSERIPEAWLKASEKGTQREHNRTKPWETKVKIDRIEAEAALLGISLDKKIPELFLQVVGDNLYVIRNELRKLALLVGPKGVVTAEQVSKVIAVQPPAEPFEVAEAAFQKNVKRAMSLIAHLYRYLGEGASVPIATALIRTVERMLVVRSLLDVGKTKEDIASQMSMNAYRLEKTYLLWAKHHSVDSLKGHMAALCSLDANVKGPARSKRTLVELTVLSIAA